MRTILMAALLSLAAISGCAKDKPASSEKSEASFPTMTPDEVDKALAANQVTPVDCNGDKTRKKYGVVPGAVMVSDEESFAATELPADKTRKLVFYCADPG